MLRQVRFTALLKLLSDLHIGTGDSKTLAELRPEEAGKLDDDKARDAAVAVVVRDVHHRPVIPATALKGALRKAVEAAHGAEKRNLLFGEIKQTTRKRRRGEEVLLDEGQAGSVWLRLATIVARPDHPGSLPFWNADRDTIITTHVAIDDTSGTAAEQKLFHVERVPAGAAFSLSGTYIVADGEDDAEAAARRDLPVAFGALARRDGLGIGADDKLGGGRITLDGPIDCTCWWFDPAALEIRSDRRFTLDIAPEPTTAGVVCRKQITVFCRGPYLTIDPAAPRRGQNKITAARRGEDIPSLPASSVLGVLRDRTAWLAQILAPTDNGIAAGDDPFRQYGTDDIPKRLTATERLFGVPGWRGLVRIVSIEATAGARERIMLPGVAIDRFAGGTLDSALYETEAFIGSRFRLVLQLDRRHARDEDWPTAGDRRLFAGLIAELRDGEDLLLGHGTNRGFGWFTVEAVE